jgi:hypothetical protein
MLQFLLFLFPLIILSLRQESKTTKQCPFHQSQKDNADPTKATTCGKISFYYYGDMAPYTGAYANAPACSVPISALASNFQKAFPVAEDTCFLSRVGLPFEELVVVEGTMAM